MNPHVRNFYIYLVLGYAVYIPLFLKLCNNAWAFVLVCLIFNRIWTNYLGKYYLSQAEAEINALEEAVIKAFKEAEKDYEEKQKKNKEKKLDDLQKKSDETTEMVERMKSRSKKD